jgi:hypothetical protein
MVAAGAVLVTGLLIAWGLGVAASFNSGDGVDTAERKIRALQSEIQQTPGIVTVDVDYQNDYVVPGVLAASVKAEPEDDLDRVADEVVRRLWLSDLDVVDELDVVVRWSTDSATDPARETRTYAKNCSMAHRPGCRPLHMLEDAYGGRPG